MADSFLHWKFLALGAIEPAGAATAIERTLAPAAAGTMGRMAVGAMRVALAVGAGRAVAALAVQALLALVAALAVGMGGRARA